MILLWSKYRGGGEGRSGRVRTAGAGKDGRAGKEGRVADAGIGDIFHIIHVSETLEPLDAFYDDVFGPRRGIMDGSYSALETRDASLVAIGNCITEPMVTYRPGVR